MTHKWSLLAEFGRQPLLVQWLALAGRLWQRVCGMEDGRLLREAMSANIALYLQHRTTPCWTADFLACLVACGALTAAQVAACTTVAHVWVLPVDEGVIRARMAIMFAAVWAGAGDGDPRTADSASVVAKTYVQWVRGGAIVGPAPHFTALLSHKAKTTLLQLRLSSYPLRIATGKNEGSGVRNAAPGQRLGPRGIPRGERTCRVCGQGRVEDLQHFLEDCTEYTAVKARFSSLFTPARQTAASILTYTHQETVAAAISAMVDHRTRLRTSPLVTESQRGSAS